MSNHLPHRAPSRRRWIIRLVVLLFPLYAVAAAELFIRLTGIGLPDSVQVQRMNPAGLPMFECAPDANGTRLCQTSRWYSVFMGPQKFVMPKPAGVVRIFFLGESAAEGYPFNLPGSFPRIMQVMLNEAGQRRFEVINAAVRGIKSSDVRYICSEIVHYQPDLVIVYMGNNEYMGLDPKAEVGPKAEVKYWLRSHLIGFRLYPVLVNLRIRLGPEPPAIKDLGATAQDTRARLLSRYWDRDAILTVQRRFRENLTAIVALSRAHGAAPILSSVAVNLRDFVPFPDAAATLTDRCQAPAPDSNDELSSSALREQAACAAAPAWPPDMKLPAATAYYEGCCALWSGNAVRARELMGLALDRDRYRLRTISAINGITRDVAAEQALTLVDVEAAFAEISPFGIAGDELFLDNVHPTLPGQALIARVMVEKLARQGLLRLDDRLRLRMKAAMGDYLGRLPPKFLADSDFTLANNLANFGMFPRSLRLYRLALALEPDSADIRQAIAEVEKLTAASDTQTPTPGK